MQELRLPPHWSGMHPRQKLFYLVESKQARDLSEAGKLLASLRRPSPAKQQPEPTKLRMPFRDD